MVAVLAAVAVQRAVVVVGRAIASSAGAI